MIERVVIASKEILKVVVDGFREVLGLVFFVFWVVFWGIYVGVAFVDFF